MADPLSVAGLAAGVMSLGIQVCGGITKYLDALECREQDIHSAKQQNECLRKTLQVVETSLTRLQHDHDAAAVAVRDCLDSSKKELSAINDLVTQLAGSGQPSTDRRGRIKAEGRKLLYPFHRPKLEQLESRLRNANVTLQLALQALGLSLSQSGADQIATLASSSMSISANLLVVQSEVSAMNPPLQGIHSSLSNVETRLKKLEHLVAATTQLLAHHPDLTELFNQGSPEAVLGRLLRKPAALREICDAAGLQTRCRPRLRHAPSAVTTSHDPRRYMAPSESFAMEMLACVCRSRRSLQRRTRAWCSLTFSHETTFEHHLPGCPAAQLPVNDQTRKFGLTSTGLRRLLNSAVQLSFSIRSGAGGWSLSPTFTYYPTVDEKKAPAFQLMAILERSQAATFGGPETLLQWEKLVNRVLAKIVELFQTHRASFFAVDAENRSLLHHLARAIHRPVAWGTGYAFEKPLLEVLEFLIKCNVPLAGYDIHGDTPLSTMVGGFNCSRICHVASKFSSLLGPEITTACLSEAIHQKHLSPFWSIPTATEFHPIIKPFSFLSSSPCLAEGYGCGPLSLAILAENNDRVAYLTERHPEMLEERNLFGHSPLHLAADKPVCLRLLAQVAHEKLLNEIDHSGSSALDIALMCSGLRCRERQGWRKCRRCQCAECALILLKADCAVPLHDPPGLQNILDLASQRCRLQYVRAMKDRRDRLKKLALDNLLTAEAALLGLSNGTVLDFHAPQAEQLLSQRGIHVPEALHVCRILAQKGLSVYQQVDDPFTADLFFRNGFHDTSSWLKADQSEFLLLHTPLPYIEWLDRHGVDALFHPICRLENNRGIYSAHGTFYGIGISLAMPDLRYFCVFGVPPDWVRSLHVALHRPDLVDNCRCKCSTEGCTPLVWMLKGMVPFPISLLPGSYIDELDGVLDRLGDILDLFGAHLGMQHQLASLRWLTFAALGIPHTCCQLGRPGYHPYPGDEVEELEEEYAGDLALLEELLEEFVRELANIFNDPGKGLPDLMAFWRKTWASRIREECWRLSGDALSEEERRKAEDIGVVWSCPQPAVEERSKESNPYPTSDMFHWFYELEKIDVDC